VCTYAAADDDEEDRSSTTSARRVSMRDRVSSWNAGSPPKRSALDMRLAGVESGGSRRWYCALSS
jgi:hypothetical protein